MVPLEWLVSLFPTVIEMVPTLLCSAMPPLASVGAQPQMARKFQILKSGASPAVQDANSRPMKQPIPLALELTFLGVMTTVVINACSAGVPQDSAGV